MKTIYKYLLCGLSLLPLAACEDDFLERKSPTLILEEQVWNDPKMITSLLANYYDRLPTALSITANWQDFAAYDEAMWSGNNDGNNNLITYSPDRWALWDFGLIRDINLGLENIATFGTTLTPVQKTQFSSELRFLRAYVYFEHVKRMGGVPLITTQLPYDFSGNVTNLQFPRNTEAEVYDFIATELDAIKNTVNNGTSQTRANKFTVLALKSRAMLYAGSIAKYNNQLAAPIATAGGEVGIPANKANDYFTKALEASREIITSGAYALYTKNPDRGENFFEAITRKAANTEVIMAQDYSIAKDKRHGFTYDNIARNVREDNLSSSNVTPTLNLVEDFEYLDGTPGTLKTRTGNDTDYIYYDKPQDLFANKDARLYGTVIYPGTTFRGLPVEMQAGVKVWNGTSFDRIEDSQVGTIWGAPRFPNGDGKLLTGSSGPHRSITEVSNSGFYMRKYIDPAPMASTRGIRSEMWWIRFRYAEVLLNAAEAAFELEATPEALGYINQVRARAGFDPSSITTLTRDRIRNERRVELAFEDHRVWDMKRWRIAHEIWNGSTTNPAAIPLALYVYRVVRPGHPTHDKYVFDKLTAPRFRAPRNFQLNNYYSAIPQGTLNSNPKIVRNPFQ